MSNPEEALSPEARERILSAGRDEYIQAMVPAVKIVVSKTKPKVAEAEIRKAVEEVYDAYGNEGVVEAFRRILTKILPEGKARQAIGLIERSAKRVRF